MEIMINATLAGGVAIGAAADLITEPYAAMLVGFASGTLSSVGFQKIGPFLAKNTNLQDTCGVNSLHGMPGILGGITSAIVASGLGDKNFPKGYLKQMDAGMTASEQAARQIYSLLVTLGIALLAGISGGFVCSLSIWQPVHALYRDDDHFFDVVLKYPAEYLVGGDEVYDEARASLKDIQDALTVRRKLMEGHAEEVIDKMVNDIWDE